MTSLKTGVTAAILLSAIMMGCGNSNAPAKKDERPIAQSNWPSVKPMTKLPSAISKYKKQDYSEDLKTLAHMAEGGDLDAVFELAERYEFGRGVAQNYVSAADHYKRAAKAGHLEAQLKLAKFYATGTGVPRSWDKVMHWHEKAAENGNLAAQIYLAQSYVTGYVQ